MASARKLARLKDLVADTSAYPRDLFRAPHSSTEDAVDEWIASAGMRFRIKGPRALAPDRAITLLRTIWLPRQFEGLSPFRRARLKVHEAAHVRDRDGKPIRWYASYARPWSRVVKECRANGAALAYRLWTGESPDAVRRRIGRLPTKLWESYYLRRAIRRDQLCEVVTDGLFRALEL